METMHEKHQRIKKVERQYNNGSSLNLGAELFDLLKPPVPRRKLGDALTASILQSVRQPNGKPHPWAKPTPSPIPIQISCTAARIEAIDALYQLIELPANLWSTWLRTCLRA